MPRIGYANSVGKNFPKKERAMINGPSAMQYAVAEKQTQQGGDWFFWIAGLSLINSLLGMIHSPIGVLFGLGTTDVIDQFGAAAGGSGRIIAFVLDIVVAGIFALFGLWARKGARWAFIVGAIFYVLDALLVLLLTKQYIEAAAHAYVLFRLFQGFQAAGQLQLLRAQPLPPPYSGSVPPGVWPPPPNI